MKECFYCHSSPEMKWEECMNFGHRALGYYVVCPHCGCMLAGIYESPTRAADAWDKLMAGLPAIEAKRKQQEEYGVRWLIAHGYRFWHIVGPDGFEFDLWLKRKSDLMTEDMRALYHQRGFARISLADFTLTDNTEKELA